MQEYYQLPARTLHKMTMNNHLLADISESGKLGSEYYVNLEVKTQESV